MTGPDSIRLLAIRQLNRAKQLMATSVTARAAVVRAYNESSCDFQADVPDGWLHPATDDWLLAFHVALGALHEPEIGGLVEIEALDYAIGLLEMLSEAPKFEPALAEE